MDIPSLVVVAIRLLAPLWIPRHPLAGTLLNIAIDILDVVIVRHLLGGADFGGSLITYQRLDKLLDTYYLTFALYAAQTWANPLPRRAAAALFVYRLSGVALFLVTDRRQLLAYFPNVFEYFFLYCLVTSRWRPGLYPGTWRRVMAVISIISLPMAIFEYLNHYQQVPLRQALERILPFL